MYMLCGCIINKMVVYNAGPDNKIIIDVGTLLAHQGAFR